MRRTAMAWTLGPIALLAACANGQPYKVVPLGGGADGVGDLKPVAVAGLTVQAEVVPKADEGRAALRLSFAKTGEERRLLAVEARPQGDLTGMQAVALRLRAVMKTGDAPRLALLVYEKDGGAWFKVADPAPTGEFADARLPLSLMRAAAFSEDPDGKFDWSSVEKVWFGVVIDGAATGTLELSRAVFTDEPYKPTHSLIIPVEGAERWSSSMDPAVTATLATPDEGPGGAVCSRLEFHFPGGKHMYLTPGVPMPGGELAGYTSLAITYQAKLPDGIEGLLLMLVERNGAQYMAVPMPPPAAKWTRLEIPLTSFKLGGWSKDPNNQFDLAEVGSVIVGTHGTAEGAGGDGLIQVAALELVP